MTGSEFNIRHPVRRADAQKYVLLSLISFGSSVIFTRLFLELTGYPQIGGGELHIAHVIWGGLLLFAASLLPLVLANRWALTISAVLSGLGVGLFIDEVGKFITASNDYFFPPAAPIIYAFFLLTVLVYLRVRSPSSRKARDELYRVLDGLTEVLDHDLESNERTALANQLKWIASEETQPNLIHMATVLHDFIRTEKLDIAPNRSTFWQKVSNKVQSLQDRLLSRPRFRLLIILILALVGVLAFYELIAVLPAIPGRKKAIEDLLTIGILTGQVRSMPGAIWFLVHLVLQALVGFLAILSGGLISIGKDKKGLEVAIASLVISLTGVNLLAFFVDQFSASVAALTQLFVLLLLNIYRKRFLPKAFIESP